MEDRSIRVSGGSGLFYFTVLSSYANFRTSYKNLDGFNYTVRPGEWICRIDDIASWFRVRFKHQSLAILDNLQTRHFITYSQLGRGNIIKFKITDWHKHNKVLDYNAPCQKDIGFFFLPVSVATKLVSVGRRSEADIILDLWVNTVYNDPQVQGSDVGPVVYMRDGTGSPLLGYAELAKRWSVGKSTDLACVQKSHIRCIISKAAKILASQGVSCCECHKPTYMLSPLSGCDIEHHAKCIEKSHRMLKLMESAVALLRAKHKNGEAYYWTLYYTFLSPQQLLNRDEISAATAYYMLWLQSKLRVIQSPLTISRLNSRNPPRCSDPRLCSQSRGRHTDKAARGARP